MSVQRKKMDPAQSWITMGWLSGVFCTVLGLILCIGHIRTITEDPFHSPTLKELKIRLRENPKDEALKVKIRDLDLSLRAGYFEQVTRMNLGIWMLLGGVPVLIFSCRKVLAIRRQPPVPSGEYEPESPHRERATSRRAVAAMATLMAVGLWGITSCGVSPLPRSEKQIDEALATGQPVVVEISAADYLKSWPRFLGPLGNNSSPVANPPARWETSTGSNVLWRIPSPSSGFNSPIVWGGQVFFSGGSAAKREVFSIDLKSGKLMWRSAVSAPPMPGPATKKEIPESTGYAPCTTATDGRHVFAIFANGELAAFNLDGSSAWAKNLGIPDNPYGHASSLTTWKDRLIVQFDQGEPDQGKSRLLSIEGGTGTVIYEKTRKFGSSWASPLIFESGGKPRVCLLSIPHAVTYDLETGEELWRAECLNGEVTPSPIFSSGTVFVASPTDKLLAIRPDGTGDVTKTHIQWSAEDNVPDVTSPAANDELIFTISTSGQLTCFDLKDGKKQWEHDFETEFHASPAIAAGRIYLFSQKGRAIVLEAGRQFKEIFQTQMDDSFHASPAFVGDNVILRGLTNIWCLGSGIPSSDGTAKPAGKP